MDKCPLLQLLQNGAVKSWFVNLFSVEFRMAFLFYFDYIETVERSFPMNDTSAHCDCNLKEAKPAIKVKNRLH